MISIKKFFINYIKKKKRVRKVIRKILYFKNLLLFKILTFGIRVDSKTILFSSFSGKSYSCSPKAIYEFMLKQKKYKNFKFVWLLKKPQDYKYLEKNLNTKIIRYGSARSFKYFAAAKYWVFNYNINNYIYPTKRQVYIQCWHGTPLKRLGNDLINKNNAMNSIEEIHNKYDVEAKKFNYMLSPSKFATEKFITAWNLKKMNMIEKIIEEGYPRNDFLHNYQKKDVLKIKKLLKLPKDKKVILYAPTWRDDQHQSGVGYVYKSVINFDKLKEKLGDDFVVLFRAHYLISNQFDFSKYKNFVYDVSNIDDINNLYIISDVLATDYSSVMFDFANLKRPIIFYMYDYEKYKNELRDFYLDINELPGPIVDNENDLINAIENTKNFKYNSVYEKFNKKFNYLDDGSASKRVVERCIK